MTNIHKNRKLLFTVFELFIHVYNGTINRIGGVMIGMLVSNEVDLGVRAIIRSNQRL